MFGGSGGDLKRKIYRNRKREMMKRGRRSARREEREAKR